MRKNEIEVGGIYIAKVNNVLTTVRVDAVRESAGKTVYDVTNLKTGRTTLFRSAAKFRAEEDVVKRADRELNSPAARKAVEAMELDAVQGEIDMAGPVVTPEESFVPLPTDAEDAGVRFPPKPTLAERLAKTKAVSVGVPHLIVEARAGTGKTTTLVEGLKGVLGQTSALIPSPQQKAVWDSMALSRGKAKTICFVAFNKSIATELQKRVPAGVAAMTMHSMGYKAVQSGFGRVAVNSYRVFDVIAELLETDIRELRQNSFEFLTTVEKVVGLCKMNLADGTEEEIERIASHYEVELNGVRDRVVQLVPQVLTRCKDVGADRCVDFNDMVWLPCVIDLPVSKYDLLLVDEAQDLNRCQQELAKRAGRRLILCGDPRQAIYGFAGADADSMPRMGRELGATPEGCDVLPLTVTRRCSKAVVREANKIVADFDAFETNGEGTVSSAVYDPPTGGTCYRDRAKDGDMVLCRTNAPLVSQCFKFLKAGRRANIQGRDIGQGIISLVKKLKAGSVPELVKKLSDWLHKELTKENAKRNPSEARTIALEDKHDCILAFTEGAETVEDVVRKVNQVFTDDTSTTGIKLSSIHKAKGLEAPTVFFLMPKGASCPHPMATSAWQVEQEWNLKYVAITRAIQELVYVS